MIAVCIYLYIYFTYAANLIIKSNRCLSCVCYSGSNTIIRICTIKTQWDDTINNNFLPSRTSILYIIRISDVLERINFLGCLGEFYLLLYGTFFLP